VLTLAACACAATPAASPLRIVKLGDRLALPEAREHLQFARDHGFEALWVYAGTAATWWPPERPLALAPDFLELARLAEASGMRVMVSINPVGDSLGAFRFSDRAHVRRVRELVHKLAREADVREFVLAFDDQPTRLEELDDILRFGRSAAPAHLDLARRAADWVPRSARLWLCASAYADAHLGDGTGPYAARFLEGVRQLPAGIGIVWTGPDVVSPAILAADLAKTRARLGGRRLLLYDNYPVNDDGAGLGLALVLGPLRGRDPAIVNQIEAYLACPMTQLGGSRLALATVAAFLADPAAYDPETSWTAAQHDLAGEDPATRAALRVQALEWGGFVGDRNYRPAWIDNVEVAAARLDEPAFVASWSWVAARYPARMADLARLADRPFRNDLLDAMARRLAVARAVPLAAEYRARISAGRRDLEDLLAALAREIASWDTRSSARRALVDFLEAADVPRHP